MKSAEEIRAELRGQAPRSNHHIEEFKARDGKMMRLDAYHLDGLELLKYMTMRSVLEWAELTVDDLKVYIEQYRRDLIAKVKKTIGDKWLSIYDNSRVYFDEYMVESVPLTLLELHTALKKRKCPLTDHQLLDIIEAYEGPKAEVKRPHFIEVDKGDLIKYTLEGDEKEIPFSGQIIEVNKEGTYRVRRDIGSYDWVLNKNIISKL